ncbi:MAG: class I SAM-dependent methyltransferase, partial [Acidobacteriota bacterium]
ASRFTMVLKHPGALRTMITHATRVGIGEAYIYDEFDIEGDIAHAFRMANYLTTLELGLAEKMRMAALLRRLPSHAPVRQGRAPAELRGAIHSKERDRQAVRYHYDVSNDFFPLWLDPWMQYSCAYFQSQEDTLETAQERKLDYLCRKLDLHPGERVLDLGCGWGGFLIYAARNYGVVSRGITLSQMQADYANRWIEREGLQEKAHVDVLDYRDLEEIESFDKIVSVGMFEHVGAHMMPEYFTRVHRLLKRGGRFLNHGIASGFNAVVMDGDSFSDKYIFPDSELLPISSTVKAAETTGFEVRDLESLREHYALTLAHWLSRLEAHHDEAVHASDESVYRTWRLNHAGAAIGFQTGRTSVYQMLCVKPLNGQSMMPLTRHNWYA